MGISLQASQSPGVEFYSLPKLAVRWGTSYRNLHSKVREGKLKVFRLGGVLRISREEVERIERDGL
jgi:predicted site-specific integrase-resolvase